jgi:OOP family OmpA-OmpF porin
VVGHTDTSGSPSYNQKLSERRANAVRAALEALGIPEDNIHVSGRGEGELMIETGDGVKEPQNRRATIDME